jgi:hypothetical protein
MGSNLFGHGIQRRVPYTLKRKHWSCFNYARSFGKMPRIYNFKFTVECAGTGTPDMARVEEMIDLTMQDLVFDDEFITALDEKQSVTIQVNLVK